jgi:hypothetical protein
MAEKVALLGVTREVGWMYFVKDGEVWKVQEAGRGVPKGTPEKVADGRFQMDTEYIYFIDADGDVARARRAPARRKHTAAPASTLESANGHEAAGKPEVETDERKQQDDADATGPADRHPSITHALQIMKEPIDKILAGTKTWEIRGTTTSRRGPIGLIQSKTGHVVGTCEVVDVVGPLSLEDLQGNEERTGSRPDQLYYQKTYAWVLRNARRLSEPIPFRHPHGAVIWIKLEPDVIRNLEGACRNG